MKILKKIFIVSTILLLVFIVFFGIYTVAFKKKVNVAKTEKDEGGFDIEELVSEEITNITSDPIISASIGPDGETIRYYDALDGRVWTMTLRGTNREVLTSETLGVPKEAKWSPDGNSAIIKNDNGEIFVYNHATNTKNKLRDGMDDVEWAGVGGKILYKYYDEDSKERSLNIANSDGTNWKKIADIPYRFTDFVQIPSSVLTAFWPRAGVSQESALFVVSTINTSDPQKIYQGNTGVDYLFSPNGKKILVSSSVDSGAKTTLSLMDNNGANYTDFVVPTVVKKSVWTKDSSAVYYAFPNNIPDNVVWPDGYDQNKFTTQDTFFKLDIDTGKKTRIVELDDIKEPVDAVNLFLSPSGDYLFFTNRINNLLYRIDL